MLYVGWVGSQTICTARAPLSGANNNRIEHWVVGGRYQVSRFHKILSSCQQIKGSQVEGTIRCRQGTQACHVQVGVGDVHFS